MIKVLGIPTDINSSFMKGPAEAPNLIRQMDSDGSANSYAENGIKIKSGKSYIDLGNMNLPSQLESDEVHKLIVSKIKTEIQDNSKIISIGGDHAISYPIIEAYASQYANLNILHFDAHPDLYHNFQNNPYSHASPFARIMENKFASSLTQVGIRTLDTHQRKQTSKFNVKSFEMKDFDANVVIQHVNQLSGPLYISIDIDALDPSCAPGVSHHEPGGLMTRDILSIIQSLKNEVVGADIVEYNPSRDLNNMTAMVAYKLFKEVAAKMT
jgi:agmatinase